jgi:hypothetical protein
MACGEAERRYAGRWHSPSVLSRGVYHSSRAPDEPLSRARAALLVHPARAVATHFSAAPIRGVPVSRPEDRQRHGLRCHVAALAHADVVVVDGVRSSSPPRMLVVLAGLHAMEYDGRQHAEDPAQWERDLSGGRGSPTGPGA